MGSEWCSFFLSFPRSDGASEEAAILVAWEFTLPWFVTDWMDKEKGNTADTSKKEGDKKEFLLSPSGDCRSYLPKCAVYR